MSEITFKGTNGKIDGFYSHSLDPNAQTVLILCSERQYEDDKKNTTNINSILFDIFAERNFSVLKIYIKYRLHVLETDDEEDDLSDSAIALSWLNEKNPESRNCWIVASNSTSIAALQVIMRHPDLENFILVAPYIKKNELNFTLPCITHGLVVKNDDGTFFSEEQLAELQEKLTTSSESKIETCILKNVKKDFSDNFQQFKGIVGDYVDKRLAEINAGIQDGFGEKRKWRKRKKRRRTVNLEDKVFYTNPVKEINIDDI